MDELLLAKDVAKILKCNENTVGSFMNAGILPYLKFGRTRKVRRLSLYNFLAKYDGWDLSDPYNPKKITSV